MSLKENIKMVKEELNQEEKLFESAVKTERFIKKYKNSLIAGVVVIAVALIVNSVYKYEKEQSAVKSNLAYMKLLSNPKDSESIKILKEENPALFDAWRFKVAIKNSDAKMLESLKSSSSNVIADLATYEAGAIKKDRTALNEYVLEQKAILKDLAILDEAVLLMKEGKIKDAKARLALIDKRSSLYRLSMLLQHYGVK